MELKNCNMLDAAMSNAQIYYFSIAYYQRWKEYQNLLLQYTYYYIMISS